MYPEYTTRMPVGTREPLCRHTAYEAIRAKILSGEFGPGTMLSEGELARQLGISRTPVREALQRLEEEGLAVILPRRGAIVRVLTLQEVREILRVREALEGLAARLAASHIPRALVDELRARWREVNQSLQAQAHVALDKLGLEFHAAIVEASGNRTLARMLEGVRGRIEGTRALYLQGAGEAALRRARLVCADHLEILDALEAGDGELSEARMKAHLRQIRTETIRGVE